MSVNSGRRGVTGVDVGDCFLGVGGGWGRESCDLEGDLVRVSCCGGVEDLGVCCACVEVDLEGIGCGCETEGTLGS